MNKVHETEFIIRKLRMPFIAKDITKKTDAACPTNSVVENSIDPSFERLFLHTLKQVVRTILYYWHS